MTTLSIFDLMCVDLWMSCVLTNPLRPLSEGAAAFFLMASRGQPLSCENAALLEFVVPVICLFCDLRPVLGGKSRINMVFRCAVGFLITAEVRITIILAFNLNFWTWLKIWAPLVNFDPGLSTPLNLGVVHIVKLSITSIYITPSGLQLSCSVWYQHCPTRWLVINKRALLQIEIVLCTFTVFCFQL